MKREPKKLHMQIVRMQDEALVADYYCDEDSQHEQTKAELTKLGLPKNFINMAFATINFDGVVMRLRMYGISVRWEDAENEPKPGESSDEVVG